MLGSEMEESTCFQNQLLTELQQHRTAYKHRVLYSVTAEGGDLQTDRRPERKELTCKLVGESRDSIMGR